MSLTLVGILGIVALMLLLFVFGMPVSFAMALVGFAGFSYILNFNAGVNMVSQELWSVFSSYGLTVIPLFVFMGQIAFYSGVNERLYKAAYKWVGHIRGGIAMATIMACAAFAAICGSNTATAATMTTVAFPQMTGFRYKPSLSTGAISCGSTLGVVIPPSVVLIIIGLSTEQSIARLFYGGIGAGLLLCILLLLTVYVACRLNPEWGPAGPKAGMAERFRSLSGGIEMLVLFFLIMTGLYAGYFTPSEAGGAGAFFAVVISLVQRSLSWKNFVNAIQDTLRVSCMVILLVAGAMILGKFLTLTRIPYDIASWVAGLSVPGPVVLTVIFAIYAFGGAIMDALALLLITIPIFFPVAREMGCDPVWFAVLITVVTTAGAVTPPVGATTYVVAGMAKGSSLEEVFKGVSYFLPAYVICIALLMAFPWIITFLPGLL